MEFYYRWSYNHKDGGADVWRWKRTAYGPAAKAEWVGRVANGLVAQSLCTWLDATPDVNELDLTLNPVNLYAPN